jgi:hypothetical protein
MEERESAKKIKELTPEEYRERLRKVRSLETDPIYIEMMESAEKRRHAIPPRVTKQYFRDGNKFYTKDASRSLAFEDKGDVLRAKTSDERTAKAIIAIAEVRGWSHMKVTGSKEFRRNVWREAALNGIHVEGYAPSPHERESVQKTVKQTPYMKDTDQAKQAQNAPAIGASEISGKLIKHGEAALGFNADAQSSYFVQIETGSGVKTVWGDGLAHSIRESQAKEGDHIHIAYRGRVAQAHNREKDSFKRTEHLYAAAGAIINSKIKTRDERDAAFERFKQKASQHIDSGKQPPPVNVFDAKGESLLKQVKEGQEREGGGKSVERDRGISR